MSRIGKIRYVANAISSKLRTKTAVVLSFRDFLYGKVAGVHPKTNAFHHQWAMNRLLLSFSKKYLSAIPSGSSILDVGVGSAPYWFLRKDVKWLGMDVVEGPNVNFVLRKDSIWPIDDFSIDYVLCTQVLEHVEDPAFLISEIKRVLRPGGQVILNAPFLYPFHGMPNDQARYTTSQLEYLFKEFKIIQVGTLGSVGSSLATIILNFINYKVSQKLILQFSKIVFFPFWLLLNFSVNTVCVSLDYLDSTDSFPLNTYLIATV
jgi:ubiquinone/menaquinone biosynthesis C-methylase UbiE